MVYSPLAGFNLEHSEPLSWHDHMQIALAIADEHLLKSLLVDCTPPIVQIERMGSVRATVGVPLAAGLTADAVLEVEEIHCVLAQSPEHLEQGVAEYTRRNGNQRGYVDLLRCESDTETIGKSLALSQAIALLAHVGFAPNQVKDILNLPHDGWHKSWWYRADEMGQFTIPFLRLLRTRRHGDGTFTLQYKDFFAQEQPGCFKSRGLKVLVEILPELHEFHAVLSKINGARQKSGITHALLICDRMSELEARGFTSQGISLYASHPIALPIQANCVDCAMAHCPLQGNPNSPVLLCQQFCLGTAPP